MTSAFGNEVNTGDIAVVGIACRFSGVQDLREFWAKVLKGQFPVPVSNENISEDMLPGNQLFPVSQLLLKTAQQALQDSYVSGVSGYPATPERRCLILYHHSTDEQLSNELAQSLGLSNATLRPDKNSFTSAVQAVVLGVRGLQTEEYDLVLCGAAENAHSRMENSICGAGFIVLKRLEDAVRDGNHIYALITDIVEQKYTPTASIQDTLLSPVGILDFIGNVEQETDSTLLAVVGSLLQQRNPKFPTAVGFVHNSGAAETLGGMTALIRSILSIYHATLPPIYDPPTSSQFINQSKSACYVNSRTRPWICPNFIGMEGLPRCAALLSFDEPDMISKVVLQEFNGTRTREILTPRDTELFVMQADDTQGIMSEIQSWIQYLQNNIQLSAADVAYTMSLNCGSSDTKTDRLAVVAGSIEELLDKLKLSLAILKERLEIGVLKTDENVNGEPLRLNFPPGVCYQAIPTTYSPKLAFMLPGLGAAYTDMLLDLCLHYPEVREVFDNVEGLAYLEGEKSLPGTLLFPISGNANSDSLVGTTILATMDSAVVTVLLAEWAIFTLLCKFGITPNALIGCSTGEFAALTMGGVADIHSAAQMFYRLSVSVARSLPKEELIKMSSIKVDASMIKLNPMLDLYKGKLYVTAEFTPTHTIVTGLRAVMPEVAEYLKGAGIEFHQLPVAIPYHTSLVEGSVSAQRREIAEFPLSPPAVPIWSCSTANTYTDDIESIRRNTTELFAHTILFSQTVKSAQEAGIDTFVEVGPRDNLASFAREVLSDKEAGIFSCDVMGRNSLTQFNHLLAVLFCRKLSINFAGLFENRRVNLLDQNSKYTDLQTPVSATTEQVMVSYLEGLQNFHQQLMQVKSRVLSEYLQLDGRLLNQSLSLNETSGNIDSNLIDLNKLLEDVECYQGFYLNDQFVDVSIACIEQSGMWTESSALEVIPDLILGTQEKAALGDQGVDAGRRTHWLMGRLAAKFALNQMLTKAGASVACMTNIEILNTSDGSPYFADGISKILGCQPQLSIAHTDGLVVAAVTCKQVSGLGIDVECVDRYKNTEAFPRLALSEEEISRAEEIAGAVSPEMLTTIWAAKEAAGKAAKIGLGKILKHSRFLDCSTNGNNKIDSFENEIKIKLLMSNNGSPTPVEVWTAQKGNFVLALSIKN